MHEIQAWPSARLELTILSGSATVFMNIQRPEAPRSRKASIMSPNSRHKKSLWDDEHSSTAPTGSRFPKLKVAEYKQRDTDRQTHISALYRRHKHTSPHVENGWWEMKDFTEEP